MSTDRRVGAVDNRTDKIERRMAARRVDPPEKEIVVTKESLLSRYGLIGILVPLVPFVEPYYSDWVESKQTALLEKVISKEIQKVLDVVSEYKTYSLTQNAESETLLIKHINKSNKVNIPTLVAITRLSVAKQSIHKVKFIKDLIQQYDGVIKGNEDRIAKKIRVELFRQSSIYVTFLNRFEDAKVGKIGTYIATQFPMDSFLEGVNKIALDESDSVSVRADDIMDYMLVEQDIFFTEMEKKMRGEVSIK